MENAKNLWPDLEAKEINSPVMILKQQAVFLGEKTKNILKASVERKAHPSYLQFMGRNVINHYFYIIAPILDNYTYELFYISQNIENLYPLSVFFEDQKAEVQNDEEFTEILSKIFSSPKTLQVIQTLLAQSQ